MSAVERRQQAAGRFARAGRIPRAEPREFERLVDLSVDMLCTATTSGRFLVVNPAWFLTLGYTEDELVGRRALELVHPDDHERTVEEWKKLDEPGYEVRDFENRFLHRNGETRWLLWSARSDGERLYAVARDVTERKRAEAELERSEAGFRGIFERSLDAIVLFDDERRMVDGNPAACTFFGLTPDELRMHSIDSLASTQQLLTLDEIWSTFMAAGRQSGEFGIALPGGGQREIEYAASASVMPGIHLAIFRDVTARKEAERAAQEASERFRSAFENAPIGMAVFNLERGSGHRPIEVNRAICEILGYSQRDLLDAVAPADLVHPDDFDIGRGEILRFLRGETETCGFEKRFVRGDGNVIWGQLRLSLVRDEQGDPLYGLCQFQDVTARREAHDALRQSELRLRTLLETANEGIWVVDPLDHTMFVNARIAEMLGYAIEEMLGRPVYDFFDEPSRVLVRELMEARRRGESDQHELQLRRKDGGEVWAIVTGSPFVGLEGNYDGSLAMVTDITERKLQEQAVRASAERYRNIIETTSEGVWMIDADHRTTYVNARMAEMLGYTVEEMLGRPVAQFVRESRRDPLETGLERHGLTDQREVCYVRKDGSEMWGLLSGSPLTDGSGAYGGALAMISDITERKHAEEQLARLAAIVDASPDAIFSTNADGIVSSWNLAAQQLYGYSAREVIGRPVTRLVPEDRFDEIERLIGRLREGDTIPAFRTEGLSRDGRRLDLIPSLSAIRAADGAVVGALAIVRCADYREAVGSAQ